MSNIKSLDHCDLHIKSLYTCRDCALLKLKDRYRKIGSEKIKCETCGYSITQLNFPVHLKSKKHQKNLKNNVRIRRKSL